MLKKEEYIRTVRRPYPPFWGSLILQGISEYGHYTDFVSERFAIRNMIKSDETWYYAIEELRTSGLLALRTWASQARLEAAIAEFERREQVLLSAAGEDLSSFVAAYRAYMPAVILVFGAEEPLVNRIQDALSEKLAVDAVAVVLDDLNTPLKPNYYKQEEYELVTSEDLATHVARYVWLNSRYGEENPYTAAEARQRLAAIDRDAYLAEWKLGRERVAESVDRARELLGADAYLVDFLQFIVYYRTHRTDVINRVSFEYIEPLKELAADKDLTYEQLLFCLYDEITGTIPDRDMLQARMDRHSLVMENGTIRCLHGEASDQVARFLEEAVDEVAQVTGSVAQRGRVTGVVKVIASKVDFEKVMAGDVLVTSMTTPDMVPLMQRAAAFVTDEGGITCHAAVISREMGKPCIIGTRVATQVLKDGDEVEVDADRGIVRKL